jgi:hypothetical protein
MMKRTILIGGVVVLALAYVVGFWPQRQRAVTAEAEVTRLQGALAASQEQVRLGVLLGHLLRLADAVAAKNYGEAASLASVFFDAIRAEGGRASRPESKQTLERILQTRDQVTSAIARAEPSVSEVLRDQQIILRRALGYPVL